MLEAVLDSETAPEARGVLAGVAGLAQRLWTSDQLLSCDCVPLAHRSEFCTMLNAALRDDDPMLLAAAMPLIRAINSICVARSALSAASLRLPPAHCCFRGGGLPDAHCSFFVPGRKYRVPGFLATSFSREVLCQ